MATTKKTKSIPTPTYYRFMSDPDYVVKWSSIKKMYKMIKSKKDPIKSFEEEEIKDQYGRPGIRFRYEFPDGRRGCVILNGIFDRDYHIARRRRERYESEYSGT